MLDVTEIVKHPEFNPESSHIVRYGRVLHDFSCSRGFLFGGDDMGKLIDLTGRKFGRLTVIKRVFPNAKNKHVRWECECSCGVVIKAISGDSLKSGNTRSCGCLKRDLRITHGEGFSHGKKSTKEYRAWADMKQRCSNPNNRAYKHYGLRGIEVCGEWVNNYENFLEDMGRCPKGLTLDRIDNDGNYEPGNCKWSTMGEQNHNRRDNIWVKAPNGKKRVLHDWVKKLGVSGWRWWDLQQKGLTNEIILKHFLTKTGVSVSCK